MEFTFECQEGKELVHRSVRLFQKTMPNLLAAVSKLAEVPNFLDQSDLFGVFFRPDTIFFEVDDVGMLGIADMQYGQSASVHITFWDKRLRGREELCQKLADWITAIANLQFVWTVVPISSRAVLAFAKRIGFVVVREQNGVALLHYQRRG